MIGLLYNRDATWRELLAHSLKSLDLSFRIKSVVMPWLQ